MRSSSYIFSLVAFLAVNVAAQTTISMTMSEGESTTMKTEAATTISMSMMSMSDMSNMSGMSGMETSTKTGDGKASGSATATGAEASSTGTKTGSTLAPGAASATSASATQASTGGAAPFASAGAGLVGLLGVLAYELI